MSHILYDLKVKHNLSNVLLEKNYRYIETITICNFYKKNYISNFFKKTIMLVIHSYDKVYINKV